MNIKPMVLEDIINKIQLTMAINFIFSKDSDEKL